MAGEGGDVAAVLPGDGAGDLVADLFSGVGERVAGQGGAVGVLEFNTQAAGGCSLGLSSSRNPFA